MLTLNYSETHDSCGSFTFQIIDIAVGRHHHLFSVLSISKLDIFESYNTILIIIVINNSNYPKSLELKTTREGTYYTVL